MVRDRRSKPVLSGAIDVAADTVRSQPGKVSTKLAEVVDEVVKTRQARNGKWFDTCLPKPARKRLVEAAQAPPPSSRFHRGFGHYVMLAI